MTTWGSGWSSLTVLQAKYIVGGCDGIIEWVGSNLPGQLANACPEGRPGTVLGWTITCFGNVVDQSGVQSSPTSVTHPLPGPEAGSPSITIYFACGS